MEKKITYIGFYDFPDSSVKRNYAVSAADKMKYIIGAFVRAGIKVEVISASGAIGRDFRIYKGEVKERDGYSVRLFPTFSGLSFPIRKARVLWHLICLFCYLVFKVKKNGSVIVYHSLAYYKTIIWAKRIKRFRLILEVEEIYQDVSCNSKSLRKIEYRMFDIADAYTFSTELLDQKLNASGKPCVINYGTYLSEPQIAERFDDGRIHVVYAGTFDPRKGGVSAAVAAAEYLPANYHLHILGFGSVTETDTVKELVAATQAKTEATVTFDGMLRGREYTEFLQKCHIGLSTQNPDAAFNATSFPSKVLSYMSNGLSVVSIDIDAVAKSKVGSCIWFYTCQTPRHIAAAILSAKIDNKSRQCLVSLDREFLSQIPSLLQQKGPGPAASA